MLVDISASHFQAVGLPRAIIFDFDNTLVDTMHHVKQAREVTLQSFGIWSDARIENSSASSNDFFALFPGDKQAVVIECFYKAYRESTIAGVKIFPGAEDFLRLLKAFNIPLVIVSNKKQLLLQEEIQQLNWGQYFVSIVGSNGIRADKPGKDGVHHALSSLALQPSADIWFVGDSNIDIECAVNVGCFPLLFGDKQEFDENKFLHLQLCYAQGFFELIAAFRKAYQTSSER
jgi:phosphoglycolate phosphatase